MPVRISNTIFTDNDYFQLFPNGIIQTRQYKPRPLYPVEQSTLKTLLRNPLLEEALRNEFGQRQLNETEINALKAIFRSRPSRDPVIEQLFEETLEPYIKPRTDPEIEVRIVPDQITRPQLTFEELQLQLNKVSRVIEDRRRAHQERLRQLYTQDRIQADRNHRLFSHSERSSDSHRSQYENSRWVGHWTGDISPLRFWFDSDISTIDKTNSLRSYKNIVDTSEHDSWYYRLTKSAYQEITINLTPEATEREYGRVFFNTESRYTSIYNPYRRPYQNTVRSYSVYKNRKAYCPKYINPNKGVLFHKQQDGSILKKITLRGETLHRFFAHIDSTKFNRSDDTLPYRIARPGYVAGSL
jgi:hypothetical protein